MTISKYIIFIASLFVFSACSQIKFSQSNSGNNGADSTGPNLPNSNYPETMTSHSPLAFSSVYSVSASSAALYIATDKGALSSVDGGADFTSIPAMSDPARPDDPTVIEIFALGGLLYSVTDHGIVLVSNNGGQTAAVVQGISNIGLNVGGMVSWGNFTWSFAQLGSNIYLSNTGPDVFVSTNGGSKFTPLNVGSTPTIFNQIAVSNGSLYIASQNGLYISTDGGQTFTLATTAQGLAGNLVDFVYVFNGVIYAVSEYNNNSPTLSTSRDGGQTFTTSMDGIEIVGMFMVGSEIFVKSYNGGGNYWVSQDNGVTFSQISSAYTGYPLNGLGPTTAILGGSIFVNFPSFNGYSTQVAYSPNGGLDFITFSFVTP